MTKLEELRIRLASLNKSPVFAKVAAAEELIECAVELLEQQDARIRALESTGEGEGDK